MLEAALFSGRIYTADKNFARPPVATVATNSKSVPAIIKNLRGLWLAVQVQIFTLNCQTDRSLLNSSPRSTLFRDAPQNQFCQHDCENSEVRIRKETEIDNLHTLRWIQEKGEAELLLNWGRTIDIIVYANRLFPLNYIQHIYHFISAKQCIVSLQCDHLIYLQCNRE